MLTSKLVYTFLFPVLYCYERGAYFFIIIFMFIFVLSRPKVLDYHREHRI